ncbi:MAG: hypothetical protein WA110_02410 [Anaerolineaceae bacterium]
MPHFKKPFQVSLFVALIVWNAVILASLSSSHKEETTKQVIPPKQSKQVQDFKVYIPLASKAAPVEVLKNSSVYTESDGEEVLHIVGEVANNSNKPIQNVTLTASLYRSASSTSIATIHGQPFQQVIGPGERACFNLYILKPAKYASYSLAQPNYQTSPDLFPEFTFSEVAAGFDANNAWYQIRGKAQNQSGAALDNIRVVGTLYNPQGDVVGCDQSFVSFTEENPYEAGDFTLYYMDHLYSRTDSYQLGVTGSQP